MVTRQMCGRAHLDLLGRRCLLAPHEGQAQAACQRAPAPAHVTAADSRAPPEAWWSIRCGVPQGYRGLGEGVARRGRVVRDNVVPAEEAVAGGLRVSSPA